MLEFREEEGPLKITVGDTTPAARLTVYGLVADPATSTATFSLYDTADAKVVDTEAATVSGVGSYSEQGETRWKMTLTYSWAADELEEGSFWGQFTVTLPAAAGTFAAPPDRTFSVLVYP